MRAEPGAAGNSAEEITWEGCGLSSRSWGGNNDGYGSLRVSTVRSHGPQRRAKHLLGLALHHHNLTPPDLSADLSWRRQELGCIQCVWIKPHFPTGSRRKQQNS